MRIIVSTPTARRAIIAGSLPLAVVLLGGCGSGVAGSSTARGPVPNATAPLTVTDKGATATTKARMTRSDVRGRKFDLGTIVRVEKPGDLPVIIFDRWTARGLADSTLAAKGVPIGVHADAPYQNANTRFTYRIPVAPGARFIYRHCVAVGQPPAVKPSTLEGFARLQDPEKVILLTLDQHGRVFNAQNEPAC